MADFIYKFQKKYFKISFIQWTTTSNSNSAKSSNSTSLSPTSTKSSNLYSKTLWSTNPPIPSITWSKNYNSQNANSTLSSAPQAWGPFLSWRPSGNKWPLNSFRHSIVGSSFSKFPINYLLAAKRKSKKASLSTNRKWIKKFSPKSKISSKTLRKTSSSKATQKL